MTMIYVERRMNPIFRILGASGDRMKVILFDQRKQQYAQRWVSMRRLAADEDADLFILQVSPQHYAPNLGDLHAWRVEHPLAHA